MLIFLQSFIAVFIYVTLLFIGISATIINTIFTRMIILLNFVALFMKIFCGCCRSLHSHVKVMLLGVGSNFIW